MQDPVARTPRPDGGATPHRRVHYFHGFDPATVTRYRRIFEAASSRLGVDTRDLPGAAGWEVLRDGLVTQVHHCRYEDLVRAWQGGPLCKRVARGLLTLVFYRRDGALRRMARLGPRNLGLAISPLMVMVALSFGLMAAAIALGHGLSGALLALALSVVVLSVAIPSLYLHLVMDLFAYMRVLAIGRGPVWDAFIARVRMLAGSVAPGPQETLLVGHSLGGIAAIHALDAVLDDWPADRPIGLLTLGSTHGTVLVQKGAGRDRLAAAIGRIARDRRVFWVDVSSPRDAFCLPLLDSLCLIDAQPGMESPRVLSARLARAPRIPGDRRTVFAAMRRHMGYLLAPVDGSGFDFADTISGVPDLHARFGPRKNSPRARIWHR